MSESSSCSELASDLLYSGSHPPVGGPGGDTVSVSYEVKLEMTKRDSDVLTKADLQNLKSDLEKISAQFGKYDFDRISKQEISELKAELDKFDLRGLAK